MSDVLQAQSNKLKDAKIAALWRDIARGFSTRHSDKFDNLCIKHLTYLDAAELDGYWQDAFERASSRLPTEVQSMERLIQDGSWSKEKEQELLGYEPFITNLKDTKAKQFRDTDRNHLQKLIDDAEFKMSGLRMERIELLGITAERYAGQVVDSLYVSKCVFSDAEMQVPLANYSMDTDDGEPERAETARQIYSAVMSEFTERAIKMVALHPFFMNCLCLADGDVTKLYGKPSIKVTIFQAATMVHGMRFRSIMQDQNVKPPSDVMSDPDKLVEWHDSVQSAEEAVKRMDKGNVGLTGLKKQDYQKLGIQGVDMVDKLSKLAEKRGGKLDMDDIVKAHGL